MRGDTAAIVVGVVLSAILAMWGALIGSVPFMAVGIVAAVFGTGILVYQSLTFSEDDDEDEDDYDPY